MPVQQGCSLSRPVRSVRVVLVAPRGFCAGVRRAIAAVEDALALHGAPVYVRRAIVHNQQVVQGLEAMGAVFVEELAQVPDGSVVILSAHGVPTAVRREASRRGLLAFDAVCPLVSKVHREVVRHHESGRHIVLIGHRGHPEIVGTLGQIPEGRAHVVSTVEEIASLDIPAGSAVAFAVQTTFSVTDAAALVAALSARFVDLLGPASSDICYATTNRQEAIRAVASDVDAVIVAGEHFSSNANRLAEVARAEGCRSVQLVPDADSLDWDSLEGARAIAVTAAASTPEVAVAGILAALGERFAIAVEESAGTVETAVFGRLRVA